MCLSSPPKMPDPLPPPQLEAVAEVEEGSGLKRANERRSQLLIKKGRSVSGAASTGASV